MEFDELRNVTGNYGILGKRGCGKTELLFHIKDILCNVHKNNVPVALYDYNKDEFDKTLNPDEVNFITSRLPNVKYDGYFIFDSSEIPDDINIDKNVLTNLREYESVFVRTNSSDAKKYKFNLN
jgi:ABC-type phosphate/phosphonate transport system ATPase subunit